MIKLVKILSEIKVVRPKRDNNKDIWLSLYYQLDEEGILDILKQRGIDTFDKAEAEYDTIFVKVEKKWEERHKHDYPKERIDYYFGEDIVDDITNKIFKHKYKIDYYELIDLFRGLKKYLEKIKL